MSHKKRATRNFFITLEMFANFKNFFTVGLSSKFATTTPGEGKL